MKVSLLRDASRWKKIWRKETVSLYPFQLNRSFWYLPPMVLSFFESLIIAEIFDCAVQIYLQINRKKINVLHINWKVLNLPKFTITVPQK